MAIVEMFYCFCYFQAAAAKIMEIPIIATEQVSKYNFFICISVFFFIEKLICQCAVLRWITGTWSQIYELK